MNPYEAYAKKALRRAPDRLVGVVKTRAEARVRYSEIVAEMQACEDSDTLTAYLDSLSPEIAQFQAELRFFWEGDGLDFIGLASEIENRRLVLASQESACADGPAFAGNW